MWYKSTDRYLVLSHVRPMLEETAVLHTYSTPYLVRYATALKHRSCYLRPYPERVPLHIRSGTCHSKKETQRCR